MGKYILAGVAVLLVSAFLYFSKTEQKPIGSIITGQEYQATTTAGNAVFGAQTTGALLKTGFGSLGSVVVTGANTGILNFYDATTTNVNLRMGSTPTSTIHIASIPESMVAGTYTFDAEFTTGLLMDLYSGSMPTTTVTWR